MRNAILALRAGLAAVAISAGVWGFTSVGPQTREAPNPQPNQRAVAEDFTGPGTFAGAIAIESASPAEATAALGEIYADALQPCPNDPVCSITHVFTMPGIPGSKGQELIPYRKFGRLFAPTPMPS